MRFQKLKLSIEYTKGPPEYGIYGSLSTEVVPPWLLLAGLGRLSHGEIHTGGRGRRRLGNACKIMSLRVFFYLFVCTYVCHRYEFLIVS